MRINYRNWPALQVVDPEKCAEFIQNDREHFFCAFNAGNILNEIDASVLEEMTFQEIKSGIFAEGMKVYYIGKSFFEALKKSAPTLYKMLVSREECLKVHEDCAFIMNDILWIVKTFPSGIYRLIRIHKEGALFTSFHYKFEEQDDANGFSTSYSTADQKVERSCLGFYYIMMMLKKYGEVDIETIAKKKRIKSTVLNDKAINDSGIDVQVLDSRWFTTICREEGFLVSGHFRLQPCKDEQGEWARKLIYINPYAKHGYHRLAPIVNLNEE